MDIGMNRIRRDMYTILTFVNYLYNRIVHIRILDGPRGAPILEIYMFFNMLCGLQPLGMAVAVFPDQKTNPVTEDKEMKTDGQTIKGNEMDMATVKAWAKRAFSEERITVVMCKLVVAGYLGIVLAQVIQTY